MIHVWAPLTDRPATQDLVNEDWHAVHAYDSGSEVVRYMPFKFNVEQEWQGFVAPRTE